MPHHETYSVVVIIQPKQVEVMSKKRPSLGSDAFIFSVTHTFFFDISYFEFSQLLKKARGIHKTVLFRWRRLAFVVLRCEGNCRTQGKSTTLDGRLLPCPIYIHR